MSNPTLLAFYKLDYLGDNGDVARAKGLARDHWQSSYRFEDYANQVAYGLDEDNQPHFYVYEKHFGWKQIPDEHGWLSADCIPTADKIPVPSLQDWRADLYSLDVEAQTLPVKVRDGLFHTVTEQHSPLSEYLKAYDRSDQAMKCTNTFEERRLDGPITHYLDYHQWETDVNGDGRNDVIEMGWHDWWDTNTETHLTIRPYLLKRQG